MSVCGRCAGPVRERRRLGSESQRVPLYVRRRSNEAAIRDSSACSGSPPATSGDTGKNNKASRAPVRGPAVRMMVLTQHVRGTLLHGYAVSYLDFSVYLWKKIRTRREYAIPARNARCCATTCTELGLGARRRPGWACRGRPQGWMLMRFVA